MPDFQETISTDFQAGHRVIRGFVMDSGNIVPVEVTVADMTTDCRDVMHDGQTLCWHKKYEDEFRDLCISCEPKCGAYEKVSRPAFGRLVERKTLDADDADRVTKRLTAAGRVLREVNENMPPVECRQCGECCCKYIDAYFVEYVQIRKYLQSKFTASELKRIRGLCGMELALEKRGLEDARRCPLQDEERKMCMINDVKPLVCRRYACAKIKDESRLHYEGKGERRETVSSSSDPFFIIRDPEILIFKTNDLNRWLLLC
jgi:Fe-S-cluster containining protein